METQQIKGIACAFQKLMEQKGTSTETQWNELTLMPTKILSKTAFLQRLSSYGLNLTENETALFWDYFNLRPRTITYEDFVNIMKTNFSPQHMENPATYVLESYTQLRPSATSAQRSSNYTNRHLQQSPQNDQSFDAQYQRSQIDQRRPEATQRTMNYEYSDDDEDQKKHSYYLSKSIKDRTMTTLPLSDVQQYDTLSKTTIQRQNFDGPDSQRKSFRTRNSLKKTMAIISDAAYSIDTSSWSCFKRWRDPTKDTIDATDLINALQRDVNVRLNLADVQNVIDRFGPLDQHTFKIMLTEGHKYSLNKDFDDNNGL